MTASSGGLGKINSARVTDVVRRVRAFDAVSVFRDSSDGRSATRPDGRLNWPKVGLARA